MTPAFSKPNLDPLYSDLTHAFPHPFDWMDGIAIWGHKPPPWWRWLDRRSYRRLTDIFERHGYSITPSFAARFVRHPHGWEAYHLDAGGAMIARLAYALEPQTGIDWREYL